MPGIATSHQAVKPHALPHVSQLDLVALPIKHRRVPGPSALAAQNALRAAQCGLRLGSVEPELARDGLYMQRRQGTPLQQAVHGLTGARRLRVCCRPGRRRR